MSLERNNNEKLCLSSIRFTYPVLTTISGSILTSLYCNAYKVKNKYFKNRYLEVSYLKNFNLEYNIFGGILGLSIGSLYIYLEKPIIFALKDRYIKT